jgi:hypothetical protein
MTMKVSCSSLQVLCFIPVASALLPANHSDDGHSTVKAEDRES